MSIDVRADVLTLTVPDPTLSGFVSNTATAVTATLDYTVVAGSPNPSLVRLYFETSTGDKSSLFDVTTNGPDGNPRPDDGSYTDMTADVTIDDTNCENYIKLCAEIIVTDDDPSNNIVCINFGTAATEAGTKTCKGKSAHFELIINIIIHITDIIYASL